MTADTLIAISPVDGRYYRKTKELSVYFSEYALHKYRVLVEIEYFIALCKIPLPELAHFEKKSFVKLRKLYKDFSVSDAQRIREIEKITNHDLKAVEYFIKEKFDKLGLESFKEFIHFGLTSQDINNTAIPLSLMHAIREIYEPKLIFLLETIDTLAENWKDVAMLARTHGQPASPTILGKEMRVFVERLEDQFVQLNLCPHQGKFGGATGNFNAHYAAYPEINWIEFSNKFLRSLGLERQQYTTQIEHYDNMGAIFDSLKRINTILIDFCRDVWMYISMEYFSQKVVENEVGSSAMPHKVNPIDFENAEGNLGLANAILEHLTNKLPISRLQRDLTDSTVTRNIGVPFAHILISFTSIEKGLSKLILNKTKIDQDLEANWAVVAEAVQTILRRHGYPNPYEALKQLTRGNKSITKEVIAEFIENLDVLPEIKVKLRAITPFTYTGQIR